MRAFQQALTTFFELLAQAQSSQQVLQLPHELANVDQLKVVLDVLPDYYADDEQPSYVLAIPCRPIVVGLSALVNLPVLASTNWGNLVAHSASDSDAAARARSRLHVACGGAKGSASRASARSQRL